MKRPGSIAFGMQVLAASVAFSTATIAQEVMLKSPDGTVTITGTFVDFRDESYIISTEHGEMRVGMDRVDCFGEACPRLDRVASIEIGGSDTVGLGLMPVILEGYAGALDASLDLRATAAASHVTAELIGDQGFGEEVGNIRVSSTTSGDGFSKLLANEIEISMASRRIHPDEARALRGDGAGNMISPSQEHIVAIDSLILITNPANPVKSLTTEQVRQIYAGQITNWSEVGGTDLAITVVSLPDGSGTKSVFEDRIFGTASATLGAVLVTVDTNEQASDFVNENEGALAYVSYAFQRGAHALSLVNECGIAMVPDAFSARTEEYALQRRLYMYSREDTISDGSRAFLEFATSPDADGLIGTAGFIGFAIDRQPQPLDGARARALLDPKAGRYEAGYMRKMLGHMLDYDRLSTTFRFRSGSSRLDARGSIDKARLIRFLAGQPEGTEVLLVGFTDTVGPFDGNLNLSSQRAQIVANEILAAVGDQPINLSINSVGYGELAPTACNETDEGRRINRRVEVWIKTPS